MKRFLTWIESPRHAALLILLVTLLGSGWIAASAAPDGSTTEGRIPSPRAGFLAPDFTLDTLDSSTIRLDSLRGQVVVINLWASWCSPCRAEMPALQRVYEEMEGQGVAVLGVNMTAQDTETRVEGFVREYGLTFPILLDREGSVGRIYRSRALPTTFFVDRKGVIREVVVGGPLSETTLRSILMPLISEAE
jgi:cytochrome c biogenesis protein CcmG/thiol:disulfide interchange protein DsbE